jgi:hypothetical protein
VVVIDIFWMVEEEEEEGLLGWISCVECLLAQDLAVQEVQNWLFLKHEQRFVLHFTPGLHGQHRGLWIDLSSEDQLVYITGVLLWF